jgi:hypothetical protein
MGLTDENKDSEHAELSTNQETRFSKRDSVVARHITAVKCIWASQGARMVVLLLPLACLVFGAVAVAVRGAWLSAAAATLVAWLLWRRHRRARFAAYVYFTAVAVRGALTARWPTLAFAIAAVLVLQAPPALLLWPRLTPGVRRKRGDRMRRS